MVAKSASLKGFARSIPRTVAPRICPLGSMAAIPALLTVGGLYCAGFACDAVRRGPPADEVFKEEDTRMEMKAAIFRKVHEPLTIESVEIDKPWGREVLVRTAATGVCHSDLHVVDGVGRFPLDRPIVLGHEGAGVVEAVGAEVTTVKPGDHVVACLSGFCGNCPQCLSGHPNLCTGGIVTRPDS